MCQPFSLHVNRPLGKVRRVTELSWEGRIVFYHVNGSCRAITASRGEINRENTAARGEFFLRYHLPGLSAEQNGSQSRSEEVNVKDESQLENRPVPVQGADIR